MSWMDSWSRPSKHAATPPPLYLTKGGEATLYCHTCGRVISPRKTQAGHGAIKYCSDRCRHNKPGQLDRKIEDAFLALLEGEGADTVNSNGDAIKSPSKQSRKVTKGDRRILVSCGTVEDSIFGPRHDPKKVFGRRKNRAARALGTNDEEWRSVDMEDTDGSLEYSHDGNEEKHPDAQKNSLGLIIRPPQTASEANGSVGGEKGLAERNETADELEKRKAGHRRVKERELVRRAARRACVFGLKVNVKPETEREELPKIRSRRDKAKDADVGEPNGSDPRRKCEAVMNGVVVEASFAKGEWAIRWRD